MTCFDASDKYLLVQSRHFTGCTIQHDGNHSKEFKTIQPTQN